MFASSSSTRRSGGPASTLSPVQAPSEEATVVRVSADRRPTAPRGRSPATKRGSVPLMVTAGAHVQCRPALHQLCCIEDAALCGGESGIGRVSQQHAEVVDHIPLCSRLRWRLCLPGDRAPVRSATSQRLRASSGSCLLTAASTSCAGLCSRAAAWNTQASSAPARSLQCDASPRSPPGRVA